MHAPRAPTLTRSDVRARDAVRRVAVLLRWLARSSRQAFGADSYDYLQSAMGLGQLLQDKGDLAAAEPLLREGADGLTQLKGPDDAESLTSRRALAQLLLDKGDLTEAAPRLKELCDASRHALGEGADVTRQADALYGACLQRLGRTDEEAALYVC